MTAASIDRQERVDFLLKCLREYPDQDKVIYRDHQGVGYRASELFAHIADGTKLGTSLVAVAGFVLQAYSSGV
jgi:hypothetical protein